MADASDIDASPTSDAAAAAPYPGLRSFTADEADRFFGRDDLTDLVMKRFWTVLDEPSRPAWVWVMGPSGVGKTSLLHAGFAAHLRSLGYRYVSLVPGSAPLQALADALAGYLDVTPAEAEAGLRDDAARWFAGQRRDRDAGELVLIVDQFEDALRLGDPDERRLFLDALDALAAPGAADRCVVMAGLRTEHFAEVAARPVWAGSLQDAQVLVPLLEGHQLNQAVAEPARAAVVVVDDDLVTAVLDDAAAYAGEAPLLPLVAHAMRRVWEEGDGRGMTAAAYRDIGGLAGAVAASAEGVCESLGLDGEEPARRAFNALVRRDDDGRLTLLALPYQQLVAIVGAEPADQFVAAGLLTHRDREVTLTHEALVAAWPRLQGWVDAVAASPNGAHTEGPTPADRPVEKPVRAPSRRWLRPVGALAVGLLAAGLVVTGVSWNSAEAARDDAQVERDEALSSLVARDAHTLGASDPALAGQLAVAGLAVADTHEARSAVLDMAGGPLAARYALDGGGAAVGDVMPGLAAAPSGDGGLLAMSVPSDDHVYLYAAEEGGLVPAGQADLAFEHTEAGGRLEHVALSPDGALLAAVLQLGDDPAEGGPDGSLVLLWDVAGQYPTELGGMAYGSADDDAEGGEVVQGAAFAADGEELAVVTHRDGDGGDGGGALDLWDLSDASSPDRTDRAETGGPLWDVAYHPDTARVAVAVDAGGVQLWDAGGELDQRAQHLPGDEPARSVAFHPEGGYLAAGGDDGTLWLWDVTDPSSPGRQDVDDAGFDGAVAVVAFSPDGAQLVAAGDEATVRVWPGEGGGPLMDLPHPAPVVGAGFGADGSLVSAEGTGTLRQWDLLPAVPLQVGDAVSGITFDDEGLMAAFSTGGARFWSATDATGEDDAVGYRGGDLAGTVPYGQAGLDGELSGAADLSPDGSLLAVASGPDQVSLLDVGNDDDAEVAATLSFAASDDGAAADDEVVVAVAFSPDGEHLAVLAADSGLHLWEQGSGGNWSDATEVDVDGDAGVNSGPNNSSGSRGWRDLAWAGDGTSVGALDQDGVVILYDVAAASTSVVDDVWGEIEGHRSLALNGDGSALAVGGAEGAVVLTGPDSAAASSPVVFEMVASGVGAQPGEVAALVFHPDRNVLAAGAGDAGVWLWDVDAVDDDIEGPVSANDEALRAVLAAEAGTVPAVAFDPTGRVLVAGVADGQVRVWPSEVDAAVTQLCDRAGGGLTGADVPFDSSTLLDRYEEACG